MDARTQLLIDIANQLKPNAVDPQTLLYAAAAADKLISFGVTSLTDLATVIQFDQNEYGEPQRKEIIINKKNQAQIPNQLLHDGYGTFIEIMPSGQLTQKFDLQTKLARQITERVNFKEAKGTAWEAYGEKNGLPGLSYDIAKHLLAKNPNITDISQIKPEDMPSGRLYNATGGEGETVIELKYNDKGPSFETWGRSNGLSGVWEGLGPVGQLAVIVAAVYFGGPLIQSAFGTSGAGAAVAGVEGAASQAALSSQLAATTAGLGSITASLQSLLPAELVAAGQQIASAYKLAAPYLQAGNAIYQASKGNIFGAVISGLGAAGGFGVPGAEQASQYLNAALAASKGNLLPALTTFLGSDFGKEFSNAKIFGNYTITDAFNAVNLVTAIESGNTTAILAAATQLTKSQDLATASQASRIIDLVNDPKAKPQDIVGAIANFTDSMTKNYNQGMQQQQKVVKAQDAHQALTGTRPTPQQIEAYANAGNGDPLAGIEKAPPGIQQALQAGQAEFIGATINAYNRGEIQPAELFQAFREAGFEDKNITHILEVNHENKIANQQLRDDVGRIVEQYTTAYTSPSGANRQATIDQLKRLGIEESLANGILFAQEQNIEAGQSNQTIRNILNTYDSNTITPYQLKLQLLGAGASEKFAETASQQAAQMQAEAAAFQAIRGSLQEGANKFVFDTINSVLAGTTTIPEAISQLTNAGYNGQQIIAKAEEIQRGQDAQFADALKVAAQDNERRNAQLIDRKSTRLNSSHSRASRMPSSA